MPNGPTQDAPQHVTPPVVRGIHPVSEQKRDRPRVVGQHPEPAARWAAVIRTADQLGNPVEQRHEKVGVEVGVLTLHHRGDTLKPGPGVYRRLRQRSQHPIRGAIELHEDQVPDLQHLARLGQSLELALRDRLGPSARRPVGSSQIDIDLRARSARPGVAHLPEVVLVTQTVDPVVRQARQLTPEFPGLVIVVMHRDAEPIGIKPEVLLAGHKLPGKRDGVALEIVAKGEVPQHLEEGVMPGRVANLFEIVVLSTGPDAFLAGGRAAIVALLQPEEDPLELIHPRVGEQQRRIVRRQQRRRGHLSVPVASEKIEEETADLRGFHRPGIYRPP